MSRIFKRVLAYLIDMFVVLIIVQSISGIPLINKNLDKYTKVYNEYLTSYTEYSKIVLDLNKYHEDKKIDKKEYKKLIEEYPNQKKLLNKYYKDEKITSKNYNNLLEEINDNYLKKYKNNYYKLDKYSIFYNTCYVVVTLLYFILFNIITDGATLGKKLLRLKIVNNKDNNEKVSIISYVIRSIMLYQPIYYLFKAIFVSILSINNYYTVSNIIYDIHSYLLFIIITVMIIRMDGRGLHDIVSNTSVIELKKKKIVN